MEKERIKREQEERKNQKRGRKERAMAEHGVKPEEGGAGNAGGVLEESESPRA